MKLGVSLLWELLSLALPLSQGMQLFGHSLHVNFHFFKFLYKNLNLELTPISRRVSSPHRRLRFGVHQGSVSGGYHYVLRGPNLLVIGGVFNVVGHAPRVRCHGV